MEIKEEIIGRTEEKKIFSTLLSSKSAELCVIYGRRRIGKTYLVRNYFKQAVDKNFFMVTGKYKAPRKEQITHFQTELEQIFYGGTRLPQLASWPKAFQQLLSAIEICVKNKPHQQIVLFFDELPWLVTQKSNFLETFEHIWNSKLCFYPQVKCILCGSAAAWMLNKILYAKGGLHNRVTKQIRLLPFNLKETAEFLRYNGLKLNHQQVIELYMAVGGVAQYLKQFEKGISAAQNIGKYFFMQGSFFREEYNKLFVSLFQDANIHYKIVTVIAKKRKGFTREEVIKETKLTSGGFLNEKLRELEEAGFIASFVPFGKKVKDTLYRIIDEYILFYLKWIKNSSQTLLQDGESYWLTQKNTPSYDAWSGYSFENLWLKHAHILKKSMNIASVVLETSTWSYKVTDKSEQSGAQIDLIFDRNDNVVNIFEIKYSSEKFFIQRDYAKKLQNKMDLFCEKTKTKKQIFLYFLTLNGLKKNLYSDEIVAGELKADVLFEN